MSNTYFGAESLKLKNGILDIKPTAQSDFGHFGALGEEATNLLNSHPLTGHLLGAGTNDSCRASEAPAVQFQLRL